MGTNSSPDESTPALPAAVRAAALFDWYGELLTPRQKEVFRLYYEEDMSLGEIGRELGISRQAVYDLLHRCIVELERYEQAIGMVRRTELYQHWRQHLASSLETSGRSSIDGPEAESFFDELFRPGPWLERSEDGPSGRGSSG